MTVRSNLIKFKSFLLVSIIFLTSPHCYSEQNSALPVSIYQLISNPEKYDGKEVYVVGFMHMEFEGDVIYAHREDWTYTLIQNGIALDISRKNYSSWIKINNSYVAVEGTFSATERGHFAMRSGSLTKIKRLVKWQGPKR